MVCTVLEGFSRVYRGYQREREYERQVNDMAWGYTNTDPVKTFSNQVEFYAKLIQAAEAQGFTRQEAIELLKVDKLHAIADEISYK